MGVGHAATSRVLRNATLDESPHSVIFMTIQDLFTIVLLVAVILYFSDGGPGTPKRIRIPIPVANPWS